MLKRKQSLSLLRIWFITKFELLTLFAERVELSNMCLCQWIVATDSGCDCDTARPPLVSQRRLIN